MGLIIAVGITALLITALTVREFIDGSEDAPKYAFATVLIIALFAVLIVQF